MLGLANTISSGSAPESKYSLTFDGTDDYVDLGDSDNTIATSQSEATVSLWIKTANANTGRYLFQNQKGGASTNFGIRVNADSGLLEGLVWGGSSHSLPTSTTDVFDDNWHHIVLTGKASEQVLYIDGEVAAGDSEKTAAFLMEPSANHCTIGSINKAAGFFLGKITDVAIWNVALDLAAVTAIYNSGKPTNLTFDDGGSYDNSSALVAYYKIGNGSFDDKANGVIHDQFGNTGGDLVTNGDMSDTSNWSKGTGWDVNDTTSNKAVHANHSDDGGSTYDNLSQDIGVVKGRTYRVKWTLSGYGGSGNIRANVGGFNAGPNVSANGTYSHVIKNSHASSNSTLYLSVPDTADATIDDVSVFEVAPGFGAELVTNGGFDADSNWTRGDGWTISEGSANCDGTQTGNTEIKQQHGVLEVTLDLQVGKTYKMVIDVTVSEGALSQIEVRGHNQTDDITSDGTYTLYFRPTSANVRIIILGNSDFVGSIDNVSLKELNGIPGLTSDANVSGFNFTSDTP
tara:strand:- start:592 stop:2133 length:1542 start_codon:yes stop_codon:yes gene_type:complete